MRAAEPEKQAALGTFALQKSTRERRNGVSLQAQSCGWVPARPERHPRGYTQKRTCAVTPHPPGFLCHKQAESRQEAVSWPRGQSVQFPYCCHLSSCSNEICKSVQKFYYKVSITQGKAKQNYVMKYTFALTQLHHCAKDANIFLNTSQH